MTEPTSEQTAAEQTAAGGQAQVVSDGLALEAYLSSPKVSDNSPALLICQDFPYDKQGFGHLDKALADRVAREVGWPALVFNYRGCGASEGSFSFGGWKRDIDAAVSYLAEQHQGVWTAGFGVGGTLSICAAAENQQIQGVASISASDSFQDWVSSAEDLLSFTPARKAMRKEGSPRGFEKWTEGMEAFRATEVMDQLKSRPLLVIHGQDDRLVPMFDARAIADAHASADLRILEGGGHNLRYDPRTVALLFGWLDRNRH